MIFSLSKIWIFILVIDLLVFSDTSSQAASWEGVWAQTKGQCNCRFYAIEMCKAGKGMPPVLVNRKKISGPELSCNVTKVVKSSNTSFELQAACTSEGDEAGALIRGAVKRGRLELSVTGKIEEFWSLDDYTSFPVKCR
jgi:hypothetical protein